MKKLLLIATALMLSACGYTQREGEMIGQAKKVSNVTPLICEDYFAFDLSLGVMRNGSGSMSTADIWFTVKGADVAVLKKAVEAGSIVKVKYDRRRVAICTEDYLLTSVEVVQ
jgi:hypothetical protein